MKEDNFKVDFIGIGAAKSATTWISRCINEHPEVCKELGKGTHFFNDPVKYEKGMEYYKSFFESCSEEAVVGEFCPAYLPNKNAPDRIYNYFPGVQIIVSLRNPVERAYSHYRWAQFEKNRMGHYDSFEKAIHKDPALLGRGLYYKQLRRYFNVFPKDNIQILLYKNLKQDPLFFIQSIYNFLGLELSDFKPPSIKQKENATGSVKYKQRLPAINRILWNVWNKLVSPGNYGQAYKFMKKTGLRKLGVKLLSFNRVKKTKVPSKSSSVEDIDPDTRLYLKDFYQEDIDQLEELIDKDLSHWK